MSHGLPLVEDGDDKCFSMLNAVEEIVQRQLRACKSQPMKKRVPEGKLLQSSCIVSLSYFRKRILNIACFNKISCFDTAADLEPLQLQAIPELEEGYCKAVLCRLRFRKVYLHFPPKCFLLGFDDNLFTALMQLKTHS